MTVKAQDIILNSFVLIGVYSSVQTLNTTDGNFGLSMLNTMLDEWAQENIFVQQLIAKTLTISNGVSSYTIGPNGSPSLTSARPNAIQTGPGAASCVISGTTTQINAISAIEYNMIQSISPGTGTPDTIFYDPQYPLGVINLAPKPNASGTVTFNALQNLGSFADLGSTSYTLAPGVQSALQSNLALLLFPSYRGTAQPNIRLTADGAEGKDFIRYTSISSRSMMNRRMITTARQPAPPKEGE